MGAKEVQIEMMSLFSWCNYPFRVSLENEFFATSGVIGADACHLESPDVIRRFCGIWLEFNHGLMSLERFPLILGKVARFFSINLPNKTNECTINYVNSIFSKSICFSHTSEWKYLVIFDKI